MKEDKSLLKDIDEEYLSDVADGDVADVTKNVDAASATTATAAPTATPTATAAAANNRRYRDRWLEEYPDGSYDSDEDYESGVDRYLTDLEIYRDRGREANRRLIELFDDTPELSQIVRDMLEGASFREALARSVDAEDLIPLEGDPDFEGWKANADGRSARIAERKRQEEQFEANYAESAKTLEAFAKDKGMDDTKMKEFVDRFDGMLSDINEGRVTEDILNTVYNAFNYESDIKAAEERGAIAGRNEKIIAQRAVPKSGDGLPKIGGQLPTDGKRERNVPRVRDVFSEI